MRIPRLPARAGAGFKPEHFGAIAAAQQPVGFFEVHAENYMGAGGAPHAQLRFLRERYPLSIHGVGLNIGSSERLDPEHLARLKALCERYEPDSVSEHLAWSSYEGVYFNDLLPLPYTEATLAAVIAHVEEAQDFLGQRLLIENPAPICDSKQARSPRATLPPRSHAQQAAAFYSTSTMSSSRPAIMERAQAFILAPFR